MAIDKSLLKYNYQDFVDNYKNGTISLHLNLEFCTKLIDGSEGKKYYTNPQLLAHKFWKFVSLSLMAGIVIIPLLAFFDVITFSGWWGIASLLLGMSFARATQTSASQFTRDQMIESEEFYTFIQGYLVYTNISPGRIIEISESK